MLLFGNPGETGTGPPIKTFGGDAFGINSHRYVLIPVSLLRGSSIPAIFADGVQGGRLGSCFLTLYNLKDRRSLILFGGLKYENGNRGWD
jgi:hypothetical protein